jgi:hypothetical protein
MDKYRKEIEELFTVAQIPENQNKPSQYARHVRRLTTMKKNAF